MTLEYLISHLRLIDLPMTLEVLSIPGFGISSFVDLSEKWQLILKPQG